MITPSKGLRVATINVRPTGPFGMQSSLRVRRPGITGTLMGPAVGSGGAVWFVEHDGVANEAGAYYLNELVEPSQKVKNVIICIGPAPSGPDQNRLKDYYQTNSLLSYPPDEKIQEEDIPGIAGRVKRQKGTILVVREDLSEGVLTSLIAKLEGVLVLTLTYENSNPEAVKAEGVFEQVWVGVERQSPLNL